MRCGLIGQRFGHLTVIAKTEERVPNNGFVWECRCDCGEMAFVPTHHLTSGLRVSCGCSRSESLRRRNTTHGMFGTVECALASKAREHAKQLGVPCTITIHDIHVPEVCPVLGIPLVRGQGRLHDASPTIDRIDPRGGYTPDNIAVISFLANKVKGDATSAQVLAVADWMESLGL